MNLPELLLLSLVGWTLVGALGLSIAFVRHEHSRLKNGLVALVAVWSVYLAILVAVSLTQSQRILSIGQQQCFEKMCFTLTRVQQLPSLRGRETAADGSRLLRITIQIKNTGHDGFRNESAISAYLVDQQGRRWDESRGVSGNRLSGKIEPGGEIISQPVFQVAADATGLSLILTHGRWQPRLLVIGDSDSLFHRRTVVTLGQ